MSESHDVSASRLSGQWVGLTEALAWLVTRDFGAARTLGTSIGSDLYPKMAVHVAGAETPSMMTASEAKTSLLEATRQGWVDAKGTPGNQFDPQGQRVNIDAADWAKLYIGAGDRTFIVRSISGVMNPQFWHDVLLRSDQLVTAFPAPTRQPPSIEKDVNPIETSDGSRQKVAPQSGDEHAAAAQSSDGSQVANIPRSRRGAPSLQTDDDNAMQEMRRLIDANEARNPTQAANMVFSYMRIEGLGSDDSRLKRLVRRYKKQFASEGSE